ncbi:MAG: hypothetical protein KAY24_03975 [Candidatus Eisenbacteria sp.]|nr:hypothetical protein [Candidatus Eisenbacteria bacterium]
MGGNVQGVEALALKTVICGADVRSEEWLWIESVQSAAIDASQMTLRRNMSARAAALCMINISVYRRSRFPDTLQIDAQQLVEVTGRTRGAV